MIIANWKCNGSTEMYKSWSADFSNELLTKNDTYLGVAPPSIYFGDIKSYLTCIPFIGVQDVDYGNGARTGAISVDMLVDMDCNFSIVGHSERRQLFNEDNELIKKKIESLNNKIMTVLCIGETKAESQKGNTKNLLEEQLGIIKGLELNESFTVAYEPVWAIGSGLTPEPNDINEIHKYIKDVVQSYSANNHIPSVLYGGSVTDINAESFFKKQYVDGALVGGASLKGASFAKIVNIFNGMKQ